MKQPIPQSVALLLTEAQRREKKKNAKRVANRKSASTSRARKKALVEEMTKTNALLKRQAMILALLPDLVITTTVEGEITFCSEQAERVLHYKTDDLVGAKLFSLLVPSSRDAWKRLVETMTKPDTTTGGVAATHSRDSKRPRVASTSGGANGDGNAISSRPTEKCSSPGGTASESANRSSGNISNGDGSGGSGSAGRQSSSSANTSSAAIVSVQSFPMSVVNVDSKKQAAQQVQRDPRDPVSSRDSAENLQTSIDSGNSGGEYSFEVDVSFARFDTVVCAL
jgi:PAS fold